MTKINLTKLIADNSIFSRRQAEKMIKNGLVKVDGHQAILGEKVNQEAKIIVNNKELKKTTEKIYIKLNKPRGYVCTNKVFKNEKNIFSLINDPICKKIFSLGRLDKDSHGLILLTNDGDLTYELTHPKFEHQKTYIVKIENDYRLNNSFLNKLTNEFKKGIDIGEKTPAKAIKIKVISNNEFEIVLGEGKKRQIREMFKYFKLIVADLKRVDFAGVTLGNLKEGQWIYLTDNEIKKLKGK